jgi:Cytidylate kinase-like family
MGEQPARRREVFPMKGSMALNGYLDLINSQWLKAGSYQKTGPDGSRLGVVTISRQAGSGAHAVAEALVAKVQAAAPKDALPWTIFDRNLVEKVLEDHDLPARLAASMPEDRKSEMTDTLDSLFGQQPTSWALVKKTAETILHLAEMGNVVIIGRGANVITASLDNAIHVRLVGSLERRIEHLMDYRQLSLAEAKEYASTEELGRARYVKKYYSADIEDPLLYDLLINTDRVPYEEAGALIAEALAIRLARLPAKKSPVLLP